MEALSRGIFGAQVAHLINTFRIHGDDMVSCSDELKASKDELMTCFQDSISKLEQGKSHIIQASKRIAESVN
jgi:hypothetical protein